MFTQKLNHKMTSGNAQEVLTGIGIVHDIGGNNCSYKLYTNTATYEITDKIHTKIDRYFIIPITTVKSVCEKIGVKYE